MGSCLMRSLSREREDRPSFPGYRCLPRPTACASAASAAVRGSGGTPVRIAEASRALISRLISDAVFCLKKKKERWAAKQPEEIRSHDAVREGIEWAGAPASTGAARATAPSQAE